MSSWGNSAAYFWRFITKNFKNFIYFFTARQVRLQLSTRHLRFPLQNPVFFRNLFLRCRLLRSGNDLCRQLLHRMEPPEKIRIPHTSLEVRLKMSLHVRRRKRNNKLLHLNFLLSHPFHNAIFKIYICNIFSSSVKVRITCLHVQNVAIENASSCCTCNKAFLFFNAIFKILKCIFKF